MISINGFVYRDRLHEIISRWVVNRPVADDPSTLKKIVNFNSYVGRICLDEFTRTLLAGLEGAGIGSFVASTKGELKDFLVKAPAARSARVEDLLRRYAKYPEDYYRETPFDGRIYHDAAGARYLGSTRIKRFRRIAEKSSRRMIDYMFERVKQNAEALARERAARLGIPKERLITSHEEMVAEFQHAERRVVKAIRLGTISDSLPKLQINDVLGLKVVAEGDTAGRLADLITKNPAMTLIEREVHRGNYNATNLIVRYRWPRDVALDRAPVDRTRDVLLYRGLDEATLDADYRDFVAKGEDEVNIEIIVAGWEDLLESEIGRCMHEERILTQRGNQQYNGPLAKNIEYLMEYILLFCLSPEREVGEIPIKLWIRHMPDYIDMVLRRLFGFTPEAQFTGLL